MRRPRLHGARGLLTASRVVKHTSIRCLTNQGVVDQSLKETEAELAAAQERIRDLKALRYVLAVGQL